MPLAARVRISGRSWAPLLARLINSKPNGGRMPAPRVIYRPKAGSPIDVEREFYGRLGRDTESRSLVEQFVVPIRSGKAWPVMAGQNMPHRRGGRGAGGRLQRVEPEQSPGTVLGGPHQAAAPGPRHHVRPTVVMSPVPAADAYHYRRHRGLSLDEDGAGCHDLLGTRCDSYVHKLLNGEDFDYSCHSNLVAGNHSVPSRRERRPRRAQHIPSDRTYAGRPLLRETFTGEAGGLLRVLCRDRPAVRDFHLSPRRPVGPGLGRRGRRSHRYLPPAGRRDLSASSGTPGRLAVASDKRLPGYPRT